MLDEIKTIIVHKDGKIVRASDDGRSGIRQDEFLGSTSRFKPGLGCLVTLLAVFFSIRFLFSLDSRNAILWLAVVLAVALVLMWFMGWILLYRENKSKNSTAERTLRAILSGEDREFSLFLRRFTHSEQGSEFSIDICGLSWGWRSRGLSPVTAIFQVPNWVEEIWSDNIPMIHAAERISIMGGSVKLSYENWQDVVLRLILSAKAILVLPGPTEGITWELMQIAEHDQLRKTYFVMPFSGDPKRGAEILWSELRVKFKDVGIELPPYTADGAIIRLKGDGTLLSSMPLVGSSFDDLRTFVIGP